MSNEPKALSEWARKRAAGNARRAKSIERREAYFDLVVSGYSVEQIATATKMSSIGGARRVDRPGFGEAPSNSTRPSSSPISRSRG